MPFHDYNLPKKNARISAACLLIRQASILGGWPLVGKVRASRARNHNAVLRSICYSPRIRLESRITPHPAAAHTQRLPFHPFGASTRHIPYRIIVVAQIMIYASE